MSRGPRIVKQPTQVDRLGGAKTLLGSLFQAKREHVLPVTVGLLYWHSEVVWDEDREECLELNG